MLNRREKSRAIEKLHIPTSIKYTCSVHGSRWCERKITSQFGSEKAPGSESCALATRLTCSCRVRISRFGQRETLAHVVLDGLRACAASGSAARRRAIAV